MSQLSQVDNSIIYSDVTVGELLRKLNRLCMEAAAKKDVHICQRCGQLSASVEMAMIETGLFMNPKGQ